MLLQERVNCVVRYMLHVLYNSDILYYINKAVLDRLAGNEKKKGQEIKEIKDQLLILPEIQHLCYRSKM